MSPPSACAEYVYIMQGTGKVSCPSPHHVGIEGT